jgi:tripartite ATP-independent transporter DctM subunit
MVLLPLLEAALREIPSLPTPATATWLQHLTLWMGLFGALLASLKDRHLSIAVGEAIRSSHWKERFDLLSRGGALGILVCLTFASGNLTALLGGFGTVGGWLPLWVALLPMPLAFGGMALATFWRAGEAWKSRLVLLLMTLLVGPVLIFLPTGDGSLLRVLGLGALLVLAGIGMPLFAALGGAALLLFFLQPGGTVSTPMDWTYQIVSEELLPSIPLFAMAGVILARGGAPKRLIALMRAWTDWVPGGASVAAILACAFFTAITGASGVTILALGGLLFPVLVAAQHSERFSLGLLTASGSVGLLFPPSIPVILYAVRGSSMEAPLGYEELFLAGFVPGLLLLAMLGGFSLFRVREQWSQRPSFKLGRALSATRRAWGDILLPVLVVTAVFGGFLNIVEASALAALWALILEVGVHGTLGLRRGLPGALVESCLLVGALMAVIGLAFGLFGYFVDEQIPALVTAWITGAIESRWVFLLVLNLLLLAVGALVDIFSAIVLVVPLIAAVAPEYGIHPAHLGVLFLANLELGYLTPPVGMNLFLSSLTFDRPLLKVWRASLPFLAIMATWVLLVTYVPALSAGVSDRLMDFFLSR